MKKPKWACGVKGCPGHASKMGCYQHRTRMKHDGLIPRSHVFPPVVRIERLPRKAKVALPTPLELTPIRGTYPILETMDKIYEVLKGIDTSKFNWTMDMRASRGEEKRKMLNIQIEEE